VFFSVLGKVMKGRADMYGETWTAWEGWFDICILDTSHSARRAPRVAEKAWTSLPARHIICPAQNIVSSFRVQFEQAGVTVTFYLWRRRPGREEFF
jgi:hypothetical protein